MKTFTYGALPNATDLMAAWESDEQIAKDGGYEISVITSGEDYHHLTNFGDRPLLDTDADWITEWRSVVVAGTTTARRHVDRWHVMLSFDHLYRLLEGLVADWNNERHDWV